MGDRWRYSLVQAVGPGFKSIGNPCFILEESRETNSLWTIALGGSYSPITRPGEDVQFMCRVRGRVVPEVSGKQNARPGSAVRQQWSLTRRAARLSEDRVRAASVRFADLSSLVLVIALGLFPHQPALAQASCTDCTSRYLEVAERRRVQAEIDYLNPGDPLDLDRAAIRERRNRPRDGEREPLWEMPTSRWSRLFISVVVLAGLAVVFLQNASGGLVSLGRSPKDAGKPARKAVAPRAARDSADALPTSEAAFLARIEQMDDRREALHLLAGRLLAAAAAETDINPGRSWTARESLRALPKSWVNLGDLRHLIRQAELAWFGGREVTDTVFDDCLDRARRIMKLRAVR